MSLDKPNRILLYELDSNARIGFSELSKVLSVSEGTVRYRFDSLMKEGIILNAYPVVDVGKLGFSVHKILFKLAGASEEEIRIMLQALKKLPQVNWVARFDGPYDLGCTVFARHIGEVAHFVDSFRSRYFEKIRHLAYAVNLYAEFFPREYLLRAERRVNNAATYRSFAEPHNILSNSEHLDSYLDIIKILAHDVRSSITKISKELSLGSETVRKRLLKLETSGIISGYRLALDHSKISRESYYLLIYVQPVAEKRLTAFIRFLRETAEVVYLIRMLGGWDFDVSLEVTDAAQYRKFIGRMLELFPDVVRDFQTLTTWQVIKFGIVPPSSSLRITRR